MLRYFLSPPPRGTEFSNQETWCHLIGVYRVPQAGLEAWLRIHITFVSGLFVVVAASGCYIITIPCVIALLLLLCVLSDLRAQPSELLRLVAMPE